MDARIVLRSAAFADGKPIPKRHAGEGENVSPPLTWTGLPEGTRSLALICDDPDAPSPEPWVHWVLYNIPADATGVPEGLPPVLRLADPPGAMQGRNSWASGQTIGYRGPLPPPGHGVHRYYFRLYALGEKLSLQPGLTKKELLAEIKGRVLAEGAWMGTYQR